MMKALRFAIILVLFSCVFQSMEAMAGNVYGSSSIVFDAANNKMRGYSRTELDYDTAEYYTAYVCGSLYKDGVEQVRACQGGFITATRNTQFTGMSATASVVSDHYVDMQFFDEEYSSYADYFGYSFLPGYSYPIDYWFNPANIFTHFPVSIYLGNTYHAIQRPHISSISPSRSLRGTVVDVTINGTGMTGTTSISAGNGITASVDQATPNAVLASFTMTGTTPGGNHTVTVTANGMVSDNSVTFYVQIPTSLRRDNLSPLTVIDPGPGNIVNSFGATIVTNVCGAYRNVDYTLMDQDNPAQPIITDSPITEVFSNYQGPPGGGPSNQTENLSNGLLGDTLGMFKNHPSCPTASTQISYTQKFNVLVGLNVYNLTTTNSLSFSKDASGNYTINVTVTTP